MSKKEIATLKKDLAQKFVIDSLMQKGNITKEALQPFEANFDFIQLIQKFKEILGRKESKKNVNQKNKVEPEPNKPVDWTMQLAVINYLRRLFKYEKQIFNQAFYGLKIYENIIDFLNSIRSILAQNALVLINEIFSEYVPELDEKNQNQKTPAPIINLIKIAIPVLIQKANRSQSFIKNEAKTCLETLVTNMKYNESLVTLLQLMNTKKIADFELIHTLTLKLIKNVGKQFFVNNNQFESMMSALGKIYESNKSDLYKKKCKSIIKTFTEVMTKEEFDKNLEKCAKKEKEKIKEILEERIPPNTKKEIHHHELKSKDKNNNKSCERPKSNGIKKQNSKKLLNIKLIDSKIQENKNSENINNTNINLKKEQIV